jgi:hypothetical protein
VRRRRRRRSRLYPDDTVEGPRAHHLTRSRTLQLRMDAASFSLLLLQVPAHFSQSAKVEAGQLALVPHRLWFVGDVRSVAAPRSVENTHTESQR